MNLDIDLVLKWYFHRLRLGLSVNSQRLSPVLLLLLLSRSTSPDHDSSRPTASISQDYWGDIKEDWESIPERGPGQSPGRGSRS